MHHHPPSISSAEAALRRAEEVCADRGVRLKKRHRRILEMVWRTQGPAKAYDLLAQLKEEETLPAPPTVYRALDFLRDHGLIHKLESLNAYVGCAHPHAHDHCYFLICTGCANVRECCGHDLTKAILDTADRSGFTPQRVTLEIEGRCQKCRTVAPQ